METRLRMRLVLAGLPRPQVQASLGEPFLASTTPNTTWRSSTTGRHIATASPRTTGARIDCSTPGTASFVSRRPTCSARPLRWSAWWGEPCWAGTYIRTREGSG